MKNVEAYPLLLLSAIVEKYVKLPENDVIRHYQILWKKNSISHAGRGI